MSASSKKKLRKEQMAAQLTEKQHAEQKEAKKLKVYTVTFTAIVSLILVVAIAVAAFSLVSSSGILPRTVDAVTIGSHTLTSAELNYFYVDAVNSFYSEYSEAYGDYVDLGLAYNGLTVGTPLDQQSCPYSVDQTWAEYFADLAVQDAVSAYALYDAAVAANYTLDEESQSNLDMMVELMSYYASAGGYSTTEEYLKGTYGNGASLETYKNYMSITALGSDYASSVYESLTYTDDEVSAYNDENYADFTSYSYSQFYVDRDDFVMCTDPENTEHVHTADEYAPALEKAKEAADALAASGATTAEELNEEVAAIETYADTGLTCETYEDELLLSLKEDTLEDITNWLAEGNHKEGDMTVLPIKATEDEDSDELDGYLVLLFHGQEENNMNLVNVRHILVEYADDATDEEKAEAKAQLEAVQTEWLANGGTEEAFEALVADNTADTGSAETGGLYEDVYPGQMVEAFNDWCFDESRKTGDYEIIETEYGYHLMYYVSASETTFRSYMVDNTLRNNEYNDWTAGLAENMATEVHTIKYLDLDMSISGSSSY